jgi:hypothetical protein
VVGWWPITATEILARLIWALENSIPPVHPGKGDWSMPMNARSAMHYLSKMYSAHSVCRRGNGTRSVPDTLESGKLFVTIS